MGCRIGSPAHTARARISQCTGAEFLKHGSDIGLAQELRHSGLDRDPAGGSGEHQTVAANQLLCFVENGERLSDSAAPDT